VATYRYCATDLLTGTLLADSLPLNVQSFGMQLNGGGTLSAQLDLDQLAAINAPFVAALAARRAVLWGLDDGWPVWAGVVWDWPDMSRADGTLPISAQTIDTVWSHRLITDTIEYSQVDLFTAFIDLVQYGQTKQSSYISSVSPPATRPAGYLQMVAQNGRVAGLVVPTGPAALSGQQWTASYTYSDLTQVSSAWQDMAASGNLVYAFVPGLTSDGELAIFLQLAYDQPGVPLPSSGIVLTYPGNCLDYGYQVTGSQSSNYVWATAPPNGSQLQWQSQWPHGADTADLGDGYPLMETTVSWEGSFVTSQAQVDSFADGQVKLLTQGMATPTVNVGGGSYPALRDIGLGDSVWFAATSPLHPPVTDQGGFLHPGLQKELRITGWTAYPPGPQQSEYIQLQTSAVATVGTAAAVAVSGGAASGSGTGGGPLTVTTTSLPGASTGAAYSAGLAATGGTGTGYTWSLASGSLPAGLALSSGGVISGTPTATGTVSFTVRVTDSAAATATQALSITTTGGGGSSPLQVTTTSLPGASTGTAYSATLTATGGTGTGYVWSIFSGSLPSWATLNASTGVIAGTPSTAGTSTFTVQVQDSGGATATQALSITATGNIQPTGPAAGPWVLKWNDEFNNAAGMSGHTNGLAGSKWNVGFYDGPASPGGAGYTGLSKTASNGAGAIEFYGPGALSFPSGGGMEMSCFASGAGPDGASYSISGFSSTSESGMVNTAGLMCFTPDTSYSVPPGIASTVIQASKIVIEVECQWAGPNLIAGASSAGAYWEWIGSYNCGDCTTPGYPNSGSWTEEIDLWESFTVNGSTGSDFFCTFHQASSFGSTVSCPPSTSSTDLSLAMHKYTVEYTDSSLTLWVDGVQVTGIAPTAAEVAAQFATPQYLGIALQLKTGYIATGASYSGEVATPLIVNYVRVFTQ
jgi:Putative Ig domain